MSSSNFREYRLIRWYCTVLNVGHSNKHTDTQKAAHTRRFTQLASRRDSCRILCDFSPTHASIRPWQSYGMGANTILTLVHVRTIPTAKIVSISSHWTHLQSSWSILSWCVSVSMWFNGNLLSVSVILWLPKFRDFFAFRIRSKWMTNG